MNSQKAAEKNKSPDPTLLIKIGNCIIRTERLKWFLVTGQMLFLPSIDLGKIL